MSKFVTVAVFQYPHEAYVVAGRIESEGIEVFLKDEHTVQVHNFLSNAIGGVKLQVQEQDLDVVIPMLKEEGLYELDDEVNVGELNQEEIIQKKGRILSKGGLYLMILLIVILIIANMLV